MDEQLHDSSSSPPFTVSKGWATHVFAISTVLPILATIAVILRFVSRRMRCLLYGLDDWLILVALVFYYGQCACGICTVVLGGVGQPLKSLAPEAPEWQLKTLTSIEFFYCISLGLIKTSACVLMNRIFSVNKAFRIAVWSVMACSISWTVMNILVALLTCQPFAKSWDKSLPGTCGDVTKSFVAIASLDVAIDFLILILPMPVIWHLQMPKVTKIGLSALFAVGTFDMIIGALRIQATAKTNFDGDWELSLGENYFWSIMEPGLAIIVACGVIMRPVLERILPNCLLLERSRGGRYQSRRYARVDELRDPLRSNQPSNIISSTATASNDIELDTFKSPHGDCDILNNKEEVVMQRDIVVEQEVRES